MTKKELIELAVEYGWEYRKDTQELCKGQRYFVLENQRVILRSWDGCINIEFNPAFLIQASKLWLIGPFDAGWFSLKANRFIR